jgi:hypothetical protein
MKRFLFVNRCLTQKKLIMNNRTLFFLLLLSYGATAQTDSIHKAINKKILEETNRNYFRKNRGFRNMTEVGFIYGPNQNNQSQSIYYYNTTGNRDDVGISLHTVNGYQIWPYLYAGAGVGLDRFITYQQSFAPVYLRLASEFLKKRITPYVFADVGYSFMFENYVPDPSEYAYYHNYGGLYITAGAGLRIYTRSRVSFVISAGYKRNNSESKYGYNYEQGTEYDIKRTYQRLVASLGVTF